MEFKKAHIMKQPELGQKILELRKQKGLTQEELVEQCNINVRTIQRIEAGEVSPRSYTLKAILEVLGFDYEEVFENKYISGKFDTILRFNRLNIEKSLNLAWIFGIVYFLVGFIEIATEYYRFTNDKFLFVNSIYILVKIISIISFTFFIRGFIIIGGIYKNYLLKIIGFIILISNIIFGIFDISSIFFLNKIIEFTIIVRILTFGVLSILLGISIIKLKEKTITLSIITGVLEILAGVFLLFFLIELSIAIIFPLQILEIILIYIIASKLKKV